MRWLRFTLLAAVLAIATVRYPPGLLAAGLAPVFLLVPALEIGLVAPAGRAAALGWLLGLPLDLLSLEPLGWHAFLFAVVAYGLARLRGAFFADHPVTRAILGAGATFLVLVALLVRLSLAEPGAATVGRLPAALLMSLVTGACVPLFASADRRFGLLRGFTEGARRV